MKEKKSNCLDARAEVQRWRRQTGLSQADAGRLTGVSRQQIGAFEAGKRCLEKSVQLRLFRLIDRFPGEKRE